VEAIAYKAKYYATLRDYQMLLEQHAELKLKFENSTALATPISAEPASETANVTVSRAADTSLPSTFAAVVIERSSLLNDPNMACYTSNGGHGMDGFGSQIQFALAGIAIAHFAGINFAWVPFGELEHGPNVSKMEEFAGTAYAFRHRAALGNFAYNTDHQPSLDTIRNYKTRPECAGGKAPYMLYINAPKLVLDEHPNLWVSSREVMRSAYFSTPKPDVSKYFTGGKAVQHVVLYQRRFDKVYDIYDHTFLPNEYYLSIMKRLRNVTKATAHFYVLSQSNMKQACVSGLCDEQFEDFADIPDLTMLLDLPLEDAFHVMVSADILVDSISSFSYSAAVLSLGEVYHNTGAHATVPGWHECVWYKETMNARCSGLPEPSADPSSDVTSQPKS